MNMLSHDPYGFSSFEPPPPIDWRPVVIVVVALSLILGTIVWLYWLL